MSVPGCVLGSTDLLGWWEGDGLRAQVGPNLQGSARTADGVIGDALAFDAHAAVSVEDFGSPTDQLTIDVWVKPRNAIRTQALVSRWDFSADDPSAHSYALVLLPFGRLSWMTESSDGRRSSMTARVPQLFDGDFHHVAATWSRGNAALYIDGEMVKVAETDDPTAILRAATGTPLRLGSASGHTRAFRFVGLLDEPSVSDRALDAEEVQQLVWAGPHGKCTGLPVSVDGPDHREGSHDGERDGGRVPSRVVDDGDQQLQSRVDDGDAESAQSGRR